MGTNTVCRWCGTTYDPSARYLAHKPDRCEVMALREIADKLILWADHGTPTELLKQLDGLIARLKELRQDAV
jgi:hypothetical protein